MSKEEVLKNIIPSLILEYRLSLNSVSELFGIERNELYNMLFQNREKSYRNEAIIKDALVYVLNYETINSDLIDQNEAKKQARKFLFKYCGLKTNEEKICLVNSLNDTSKLEVIRKKNSIDFTDDDRMEMIKYRYKFCLSQRYLEQAFEWSRGSQENFEKHLDLDFKKKIVALNMFNKDTIYDMRKGHRFNK